MLNDRLPILGLRSALTLIRAHQRATIGRENGICILKPRRNFSTTEGAADISALESISAETLSNDMTLQSIEIQEDRKEKKKVIPYFKETVVETNAGPRTRISFQGLDDTEFVVPPIIPFATPLSTMQHTAIELLFAVSRRLYTRKLSEVHVSWASTLLPTYKRYTPIGSSKISTKAQLNEKILQLTSQRYNKEETDDVERILRTIFESRPGALTARTKISSLGFLYFNRKMKLFNEMRQSSLNRKNLDNTHFMNILFSINSKRIQLYENLRKTEMKSIIENLEYMLINNIAANKTTWQILFPLITDKESVNYVVDNMNKHDLYLTSRIRKRTKILNASSESPIETRLESLRSQGDTPSVRSVLEMYLSEGRELEACQMLNEMAPLSRHVYGQIGRHFAEKGQVYNSIAIGNLFKGNSKPEAYCTVAERCLFTILEQREMGLNKNWLNIVRYLFRYRKDLRDRPRLDLSLIVRAGLAFQVPEFRGKTHQECEDLIVDCSSKEYAEFHRILNEGLTWSSAEDIELDLQKTSKKFQNAASLLMPVKRVMVDPSKLLDW